MIIPEERLLLAHLFADPSLIKVVSIEPKEFHNPTYGKILMAYQGIEPHTLTASLVRFWLTQRGHEKASDEMADIAKEAPLTTSVDIIDTFQSKVHSDYLKRRLTVFLESTVEESTNPDTGYEKLSSSVIKAISNLSSQQMRNDDQTFDAIRERAQSQRERQTWPTGMKHIDIVTGGIAKGEVWIVNAPYKGYKTRSTLNIVTTALSQPQPKSVLYLTYDGFDTDIYRSLLSVRFDLPDHCFYGDITPEKYQEWSEQELESKEIDKDSNISRIPRRLNPRHTGLEVVNYETIVNTVKRAKEWSKVPLRIYDGRYPIRDLDLLETLVAADKIKYNTDLVVVDYVQALAKGRKYEELASVADALQRMAIDNEVAVLEISQMSNEDIRSGVDSRMLGTKGSGDFPATADVGLEIFRSDKLIDAFEIRYVLKIARRAPQLVDQTWINPATGTWFDGWNLMTLKRHQESSKGTDEKKK